MDDIPEVGSEIWYPASWECGVVDSVLMGDNQVIAIIVRREDGSRIAIDCQDNEFSTAVLQ